MNQRYPPSPPSGDGLPETPWSKRVDCWLLRLEDWLSWVWLVLLGTVIINVTSRFLFKQGFVQLEELQWHLYAVGFLLGLSCALTRNSHIRADIFYQKFSPRVRGWVEFYGLLLLFFPFVLFIIIKSLAFVGFSFTTGEISQAPGGLPFRWIIKAVLPIGFTLLLIAGIARLLRVIRLLFG